MATKKQKEELMQTLRFTPIKVRLLVQGYGGECYIGSVSREDYEVFKAKRVDLDQFLGDWDNELFKDIPEKNRFIEPGQAYECDDLFHGSGASMDDGSYITVMNDDTNEDIFSTSLDFNTLYDHGIETSCSDDFESDELEDGTVIFWGGQGEKGCFFDAELTLTKPFDPSLLRITYGNGDGWNLLTGVEYDGVELEGYDGYSTTGKWGENKFHIVGNEAVYESVYRDEDSDSEEENQAADYECVQCDWRGTVDEAVGDEHGNLACPECGEPIESLKEWDPAAELEKIQVPVLEGEEMWASEAIDASMLSPWHSKDLKPAYKGEYEVIYDAEWPLSGQGRAEWTGRNWKQNGKKLAIKQWRGLKEPAGQI